MNSTTARYLGTAKTVRELIVMIEDYIDFDIHLEGCDYSSPSVDVYYNEEEGYIELN